jgi:hypothetical protein
VGQRACDKDGAERIYLTIEDMIGSALPVSWFPQRDLRSVGCARGVSQHCALVGVSEAWWWEEEFPLHEFLAGSSEARPAVERHFWAAVNQRLNVLKIDNCYKYKKKNTTWNERKLWGSKGTIGK